jgi:hypothetical protein
MTRKHFTSIAWELRNAYPQPGPDGTATDLGSDWYAGQVCAWERAVEAVARACRESNSRFRLETFFEAAGLRRRTDGSMYPMAAPR